MSLKFIKTYHNPSSLYINTTNKWLWLRIHKTAGTSMYDGFLKDHCINISKQNHYNQVQTWIKNLTKAELAQYTIWTFVRNPYDRFNSVAAMFGYNPNEMAEHYQEVFAKISIVERHSRPQHIYTHYKGNQVPQLVYKFENLNQDFKQLCTQLQLPNHQLTKLNASQHQPWKKEFTQQTIDFINDYYHLDFQYFNYKKC